MNIKTLIMILSQQKYMMLIVEIKEEVGIHGDILSEGRHKGGGQYFRYFTVWNIVFAIVLLAVTVVV